MSICIAAGCGRSVHAQGRCSVHYQRARQNGLPNLPRPSLEERVRAATPPGLDMAECWPWAGRVDRNGYGTLDHHGRLWMAHRLAYELVVGPIPDGLTIDHLCRNKACVNPVHLEAVSLAENIRRAVAARPRSELCKRGHPLIQLANQRGCRVCRNAMNRAWRRRAAA